MTTTTTTTICHITQTRPIGSFGMQKMGARTMMATAKRNNFGYGKLIVCRRPMFLKYRKCVVKVKEGKGVYSCLWKSVSQLRSVTCRMGSHSVTFHKTQANTPRLYPSQTGWYSICRPFKDGGLSKPRPRVQRATGPRLLRDSPGPARLEPRPSDR